LKPKCAGFFAFSCAPEKEAMVREAALAFAEAGWTVEAVSALRHALPKGIKFRDAEGLARSSSLLVSFGGDGTLLGASAIGAPMDRPVLGVNLGGLGYITALGPTELSGRLRALLDGACRIEERRRVRAELLRGGKKIAHVDALNDVVLARTGAGRLAGFEATVDGRFLAFFRADGLIFSTPTGSTAYNLSVGGPLVDAASPVLLLALISPHTLSHRPLVLPDASVLVLDLPEAGLELAADGRVVWQIKPGDRVRLIRAPQAARLVFPADHDPWAVLRDKLGWLGAPKFHGGRRA
jgi:NAD+ kinase